MAAGIIKLYHFSDLIDTKIFHYKAERTKIIEEWYRNYKLKDRCGCYMDIELTSDLRIPTIINIITNQTYFTITDAAESIDMNKTYLWKYMNLAKVNKTPFRYIDKFDGEERTTVNIIKAAHRADVKPLHIYINS